MPTALARQAPEQVLYKIPEVMAMLRMSRHVVYEQIRAGRLRVVKQGRATFVTASAIRSYVELLEREAEEGETSTAVITKVMASRAGPRVACRRSPPWWCRVCDKRSQARRPRIADLTASA